jgi:hypothetical protein
VRDIDAVAVGRIDWVNVVDEWLQLLEYEDSSREIISTFPRVAVGR